MKSVSAALFVAAVILVLTLWSGVTSITSSQVSSFAGLYGQFANGPTRLLLPIAASLLGGWQVAAELHDRWIVSSRTRRSIRAHLANRALVGICASALAFFIVGLAWFVVAEYIAPAAWPNAVDPSGFGPSEAAVQAAVQASDPLARLLSVGHWAFGLAAAAWLAVNGAVFAAVAFVSALLIRRRVVALMIPVALYLGQSIVFQIAGQSQYSFLVTAVYPTGLQHLSIAAASAATVVLAVSAVAVATVLIARSSTDQRFA
jgi:hypothetical protein